MKKYINYCFCNLLGIVSLVLSTIAYCAEPSLLVATARTLDKVRLEVVSVAESGESAQVRFRGIDCTFCDDIYLVDSTTQMFTKDYSGSADIELLKNMVFVTGSARVVMADKWVQEVRYVAGEE